MSDEKSSKISDKERVDKGQVLARIIVEVLGAPKEHVEEAVQLVVDRVNNTKDLEVVSEDTYEAEEKGKLFTSFSELEIWFKDMDVLSKFLFDFTPSSVEVVQPDNLALGARFVSGFLNDFLLKMHELGLKLKDTAAGNQALQKNADALVRNFFNLLLQEPKSAEQIAKATGIPQANVEGILENFIKAEVVKQDGNHYVLSRSKI